MAYDTMYAMVDREDDRKLGIRSSAILFGDADRFIIGIMQLMTLFALWLVGRELKLGLWYGLGLAIAAIFALYQQLLIRERKPDAVPARVPQQQLLRHVGVHRHRARVSCSSAESRAAPPLARATAQTSTRFAPALLQDCVRAH